MKQRVRVHKVRTRGDELRVLRAEPGPGRLALRDDHYWLSMYADGFGTAQLIALWSLAARSAYSLVYLPIRANQAPGGGESESEPVMLDLVLAHHSLQFPASSWKRVRARLGRGVPHTASTPDDDIPGYSDIDHARHWYREYRDHFDFDIAAHTLFIKGSARAFREYGAELRRLADDGPAQLQYVSETGYFDVELYHGSPHGYSCKNVPGSLYIHYCAPWQV
ncbi:hypothetical protein [Nocardiopsis valliformis]|uniref:hypothetical protein n=1 Tax=Nocardiopsis valliformis TaxID=239974 RepID=UPI000346A6D0|nr:hypothetical protein [Nocardiopsis valliformis]